MIAATVSEVAAADVRHATENLTALREAEGLLPIQLIDVRTWQPKFGAHRASAPNLREIHRGTEDTEVFLNHKDTRHEEQ